MSKRKRKGNRPQAGGDGSGGGGSGTPAADVRPAAVTVAELRTSNIEPPTSNEGAPSRSAAPGRPGFFPPSRRTVVYVVTVIVVALATAGVMALWQNIAERRDEARQHVFQVVELDETVIDPAEWGKNFPRQFDSYRRTVDIARTRHGGSDAFQKLDEDPRWRMLFQGYAFGVDYREERGHAYMLSDQDMTERVKQFKQPGACLHCHASILPAYREAGRRPASPTIDPTSKS